MYKTVFKACEEGQVVMVLCSLELPELTEEDMPVIEL